MKTKQVHYLCNKTLKMTDGRVAFRKGLIYTGKPPKCLKSHVSKNHVIGDNWSQHFTLVKEPKPSKPRRDKTVQMFIDFLKENNALIPFIVNLTNPKWDVYNYYHGTPVLPFFKYLTYRANNFVYYQYKGSPLYWLDGGFQFSSSLEEYDYWNDLNQKWKEIYKSTHP